MPSLRDPRRAIVAASLVSAPPCLAASPVFAPRCPAASPGLPRGWACGIILQPIVFVGNHEIHRPRPRTELPAPTGVRLPPKAFPFRGFERIQKPSPLGGSSARKTTQWVVFSENGPAGPRTVAARRADGRGRLPSLPLWGRCPRRGRMRSFPALLPIRITHATRQGDWGTYFLAAWFQTHRRPRKRAAGSAALGFEESARAGRACNTLQWRDCCKQVNHAAAHPARRSLVQ